MLIFHKFHFYFIIKYLFFLCRKSPFRCASHRSGQVINHDNKVILKQPHTSETHLKTCEQDTVQNSRYWNNKTKMCKQQRQFLMASNHSSITLARACHHSIWKGKKCQTDLSRTKSYSSCRGTGIIYACYMDWRVCRCCPKAMYLLLHTPACHRGQV